VEKIKKKFRYLIFQKKRKKKPQGKLLTWTLFQNGGKITINWLILRLPIIQIAQFSMGINGWNVVTIFMDVETFSPVGHLRLNR